jgi:hypothetical protein
MAAGRIVPKEAQRAQGTGFCFRVQGSAPWRQLYAWLTPSAMSCGEESLHVECSFLLEDEERSPTQSRGEHAECFAATVPFAHAVHESLPLRIAVQESDGGLGEGPLQIGVADLTPTTADLLAARRMFGLHEAAVRAEVLYTGEPLDRMDFIEDREREDPADAGNGVEQ